MDVLDTIWDSGSRVRLTSVFGLAAHFIFLILVIAAGALQFFLHLFQLIQVNPSNQLKVTAYLKKVQTDNGIMSRRPYGVLLCGDCSNTVFL
jgi:hypothetical protein